MVTCVFHVLAIFAIFCFVGFISIQLCCCLRYLVFFDTMRFLFLFVFFAVCLFSFYGFNNYFLFDYDIPSGSPTRYPKPNNLTVIINCYDALRLLILSFGVSFVLWHCLLCLSTLTSFVMFNTDLSLYSKRKKLEISTQCIIMYLSIIILGLLLCECETNHILILILRLYPNFADDLLDLLLKQNKGISRVTSAALSLCIFSMSVTPATCILCLLVFQIWCYSYTKHLPHWLSVFLIILSNDIHLNPGPHYQLDFFNFMS